RLPAGQGAGQPVVVTVDGRASNSLSFSYNPPTIGGVNPASAPSGGGVLLTITGSSFGPDQATATVGGRPCLAELRSHTTLQCRLPSGQGVDLPVVVSAGGQASAPASFSYDPPRLDRLVALSAPTAGGGDLYLYGQSFGATGATVTVGGAPCTDMVQTHTRLRCAAPAGQGEGLPVVVTVDGRASNSLHFSYDPPLLTAIAPASGQAGQAFTLTLGGASFGAAGAAVSVGAASCAIIEQAHNSLSCSVVPEGDGTQPVVVTVDGRASNPLAFTVFGAEPGNSCAPGTYQPQGQQGCIAAPPGTYVAASGATAPTACPPGTYQPAAGATGCLQTPPGSFSGQGASAPTPCALGTYQPGAGARGCLDAPSGTFVDAPGAVAATACAPGTFQPGVGATACLQAPPGSFASAGASAPTLCAPGTFQPGVGAASCQPAPPGSFVGVEGAIAATACAPGTFQPSAGGSACQ
ncbi:MAG TPA: IPT/TIG domain-containing protein, partial [Chloroflexaceae bacterium]|nr:IPT/TIG domain-containing protein [Chloroflexaceae bacterium]